MKILIIIYFILVPFLLLASGIVLLCTMYIGKGKGKDPTKFWSMEKTLFGDKTKEQREELEKQLKENEELLKQHKANMNSENDLSK